MKNLSEAQHSVTQEACRILGLYRRRLRAHEMLPGDEADLADILEWVEDYVITQDPLMTQDDAKDH